MNNLSNPIRAAIWMIGAMLSFSLMAIAGRALHGHLDTFEIMMYRSLLGIVIVLGGASWWGTLPQISQRRMPLHFLRNISHFAGQNLWFYALPLIPLSQLFAFEFTTPLWVAALAPFVLNERWTPIRVLTCTLGFLGILIVAKPDFAQINLATAAAVMCAIGFAGAALSTKRLSNTESVTCILFWLVVMQSVFGFVCAAADGEVTILNRYTLPWAVVVGLCGLCAHFCITKALSIAPATVVTPMDFLRLPLIAVVGYLLYNEPLQTSVVLGAVIILLANIMNIRAETQRS